MPDSDEHQDQADDEDGEACAWKDFEGESRPDLPLDVREAFATPREQQLIHQGNEGDEHSEDGDEATPVYQQHLHVLMRRRV